MSNKYKPYHKLEWSVRSI